MTRPVLVTGGSGFIGSAIVRALLARGERVRVFDNHSRRSGVGFPEDAERLEIVTGDIRDEGAVRAAVDGVRAVYHLAYVNGTEFFYSKPDLVLDVGLRGQLNMVAAIADAPAVELFVYASSSEIYQTPDEIPTPETIRAIVPDVRNPRYSYGCGKIASEMLTLHSLRRAGLRRVIVRPHNVYGPAMGYEHVIPALVRRIGDATGGFAADTATIRLQGTGDETRAFCYIDDGAAGFLAAGDHGEDGGIYHLGTSEETTIRALALAIARELGVELTLESGPIAPGGTPRRCPDIRLLAALGYSPGESLGAGLEATVNWYRDDYLANSRGQG